MTLSGIATPRLPAAVHRYIAGDMYCLLEAASWAQAWPKLGILAGLALLLLGADVLVRGAVYIALQLGLSRITVGLTLVAFGTSMPELMVSLSAVDSGSNAIALANVLGSNTFNVLLVVGAAAAIQRIHLRVGRIEHGYLIVATALAAVPFVFDSGVSRPLAAAMLMLLALFCIQLVWRERHARAAVVLAAEDEATPRGSSGGLLWHLLLFLAGLGALKFGADWLVEGAVQVAREFGMTEALIGATIVAGGTSLPELATSIVAARKGQPEISIGNIIGSNIFNVGCVLGIAGLLRPFPVDPSETGPLMLVTAASSLALVVVLRSCNGVPRSVGIAFLLGYAGFLFAEAVRTGAL